jgi:hypothetical protein
VVSQADVDEEAVTRFGETVPSGATV